MAFASSSSDVETVSSPLCVAQQKEKDEDVVLSTQDYTALKQQHPPDFDSWTDCKKQAWNLLDQNPNAFFYRHLLPGEPKKNGPWTEAEKLNFKKEIQLHPPITGHWGLFSRNIPGRVGYQCNAFYRKLVAAGEIEDVAPKVEPRNSKKASKDMDVTPTPKKSSKDLEITPIPILTSSEHIELEIAKPPIHVRMESNKQDDIEAIEAFNKIKAEEALKAQTASIKSPLIPFLSSFRNFSLFDDYRISNIIIRPSDKNNENIVDFNGSEFACDSKIYDTPIKLAHTQNYEPHELFHESLTNELQNSEIASRFNEKADIYFQFT